MLANAFFIASVIRPEHGYVFSTGARSGICSPVISPGRHLDRIDNASISHDGHLIAFVEHASPPRCSEDQVVLLEDGRRRVVARPGRSSNNAETFWVSRLRVTNRGSLIATIEDDYSGAAIGESEATFRLDGSGWTPINNPFGPGTNESLADVSANSVVAVTTDERNSPSGIDFISAAKDKNIGADRSALIGTKTKLLGVGTVTSVSETGYAAGYFANTYYHAGSSEALLWHGKNRKVLGVGVAFGVDSDGAAVGDDRPHLADAGKPTIWKDGSIKVLSLQPGTANVIRNGTIAGSINRVAFIMPSTGAVYSLKGVLCCTWPESSAFALSDTGDVFVLGLRKNGGLDMILLRPRKKSPSRTA